MAKRRGKSVPIIDLFAGPCGLGEGFSAYHAVDGRSLFHIAFSIAEGLYDQVMRSDIEQQEEMCAAIIERGIPANDQQKRKSPRLPLAEPLVTHRGRENIMSTDASEFAVAVREQS